MLKGLFNQCITIPILVYAIKFLINLFIHLMIQSIPTTLPEMAINCNINQTLPSIACRSRVKNIIMPFQRQKRCKFEAVHHDADLDVIETDLSLLATGPGDHKF